MRRLPGMGPPTPASRRRLSVIARTGNAQIRVTGWAACEVAQMGERAAAKKPGAPRGRARIPTFDAPERDRLPRVASLGQRRALCVLLGVGRTRGAVAGHPG